MKTMLPDMRGAEYGRYVIERTPEGIIVTWHANAANIRDYYSYTMRFADEHEFSKWRIECTALGPEVELWYLIGPDGLTDGNEYHSLAEAAKGMELFLQRYESQGYYKTAEGARIGLVELARRTKITR